MSLTTLAHNQHDVIDVMWRLPVWNVNIICYLASCTLQFWSNLTKISFQGRYFNYYCALLYIWHVGFYEWKELEKCIYFVIYLYVFKLVCTQWENFIRIGITVLYLIWIWRLQISVLLAPLCVASKTAFATVKSTIDTSNSSNTVTLFLNQSGRLRP